MAALAEIQKCLARDMRLLDGHRFDHNADAVKQRLALMGDFMAVLAFDDNRLVR